MGLGFGGSRAVPEVVEVTRMPRVGGEGRTVDSRNDGIHLFGVRLDRAQHLVTAGLPATPTQC